MSGFTCFSVHFSIYSSEAVHGCEAVHGSGLQAVLGCAGYARLCWQCWAMLGYAAVHPVHPVLLCIAVLLLSYAGRLSCYARHCRVVVYKEPVL